jgi:PAS domain S-box-containing protein
MVGPLSLARLSKRGEARKPVTSERTGRFAFLLQQISAKIDSEGASLNVIRTHLRPAAPQPASTDEGDRLRVLRDYHLDSLEDDPELAQIARFTSRLCEVPVALVSLIEEERQRFLAREGLAERETPRGVSFCAHAMLQNGLMEIRDATLDERFADNPLVTGEPYVRFYAGQPLTSEEGLPLGTLCVIDTAPRPEGLTAFQREGLEVLAQTVMRRLRSRRHSTAARREFEQRETLLHALADSIPAIAWSADGEGNFDFFNRQMIEFTGDGSHEDGSAIHPDDFGAADARWRECLETGETYETQHRVRRHDGQYRWMMARAVPVVGEDGRPTRWFGTAVDIHDVQELSQARDLLAKELSHRIKNIFAVVSGLISLSARKRPDLKQFGEELIETIRALGRAHDYVRPAEGARQTSLHGMLADLFGPYGAGDAARIAVNGDNPAIAPNAATPLALVFHELATNSAKYGALAAEEGTVELSIADRGDTFLLRWVERGGAPPAESPTEGFGSHLVQMSVAGPLGGSWERRFESGGMICELTVSKAAIAA